MKNAHWVITILFVIYLLFMMGYTGLGSWDLNRTSGWNLEDANSLKRKLAIWMFFVTIALWLFKIKKIPWNKFVINTLIALIIVALFLSTDQRFYDILSVLLKVGIGFFLFIFWDAISYQPSTKEWKEDGPLDDI